MPITLTLVVSNLGPDYVAGVVINNLLPDGTSVSSTSVVHCDGREFPGGCFVGTGSVSCAVGSLAPNQFATITVVFTAAQGRNSIRSWTFAGLNREPNLANNSVETSFTVLSSSAIPLSSQIFVVLLLVALALIATRRIAAV